MRRLYSFQISASWMSFPNVVISNFIAASSSSGSRAAPGTPCEDPVGDGRILADFVGSVQNNSEQLKMDRAIVSPSQLHVKTAQNGRPPKSTIYSKAGTFTSGWCLVPFTGNGAHA